MKRGLVNASFPQADQLPEGFLGAALFDHSRGRVAHWSSGFWERLGRGEASERETGHAEHLLQRLEELRFEGSSLKASGGAGGLRLNEVPLSEELSLLLLTEDSQQVSRLASRLYSWHRECVTDIVGMIAEDIQGTASSLLYNATYLATQTGTIQAREARDDILATSQATTSLLGRLSDLVRLRESAREVVSLGELLEGARAALHRRAGEPDLDFVEQVDPGLRVSTNAILAQQALCEVLLNAMQSGGVTRIEVSSEVLAIQGAPLVRIRVEDDGEGISVDMVDRVFQPLFSTAPDRAGLGLTVARESARALGGELILDRRSGPTSFALLLPHLKQEDLR